MTEWKVCKYIWSIESKDNWFLRYFYIFFIIVYLYILKGNIGLFLNFTTCILQIKQLFTLQIIFYTKYKISI